MTGKEKEVYHVLEKLGISFERYPHPPVFTVEQAEKYWENITGTHCKNLFLRNKKGSRHYLVVMKASKKADLKSLTDKLGEDRLSFASSRRLDRFLGQEAGSVSPFGLINDRDKKVEVIIDSDLKRSEKVNFHPNVNTATIGIDFSAFEKFLNWCGNRIRYLQLNS